MTAVDWLKARRELEQAATEGPWEWDEPSDYDWPDGDQSLRAPKARDEGGEGVLILYGWGYDASGIEARSEDRSFIADARTALPRALDALEKVLALHQPEAFHDDPSSSFCARCQRTAGIWPCETVDTIESALGIEAGGDQ